MPHTVQLAYCFYQTVIGIYRLCLVRRLQRHIVRHDDMAVKAYYLVSHRMFEPQHYAD